MGFQKHVMKDTWNTLVLFFSKKDYFAMPDEENYAPEFLLKDNNPSVLCIFSDSSQVMAEIHHQWSC